MDHLAPPYRGAGVRGQPRQRRPPVRARLLAPAPPPEGDRGSPRPRHGRSHPRGDLRCRRTRGEGGRLRGCGHHRVHRRCQRGTARRPHLLHGDEHPPASRTPRSPRKSPGSIWSNGSCAWRAGRCCRSGKTSCRSTAMRLKRGFMRRTRRRGFCRAQGRLDHFDLGHEGRIETGVEEGDEEISPNCDPMIAKLVAHGNEREAAALPSFCWR